MRQPCFSSVLYAALVGWILAAAGSSLNGQVLPFLEPLARSEPFSVPAEELHRQMSELQVPDHVNQQTFLDSTAISFDAEGRQTIASRQVYRILTEAGVDQYSSLSAAWAPWHQKRPVLKARVIDKRGKAHELHESEISEAPVQRGDNLFSDRRMLQAPLPAVEVGSIIETLIVIEDNQPSFSAGTGSSLPFHSVEPTYWIQLKVSVPEGFHIHFADFGESLKHSDETKDGRRELNWSLDRHLNLDFAEANVPADVTQGTQVFFCTGKSWSEMAESYQRLIEKQLADETLKSTASMVLEGETDRTKKIEKLLTWLQSQIRYTGLLFGDGTIVPAAPSDVIRRRYGDCKDQSILLTGLLRASGIEAWPVLVRSSQGWDVHRDMPCISFFNHMIVYVPGAPDLWIDPTSPLLPLGELPLPDQGRRCLVIRPESKELVVSPIMSAADTVIRIDREIRPDNYLGVTIEERNTYSGLLAQEVREFAVSNGDKEMRNWIREIGKARLNARQVEGIRFSAMRDMSKPAEFSYETNASGIAEFRLRGGEVALRPGTLLDVLPSELRDLRPYMTVEELSQVRANYGGEAEQRLQIEKQQRRKHPLRIQEPQCMEYTVRIHVPPGFRVQEIPEPFSIRRGDIYIEGRCDLSTETSILTATYRAGTGNTPLSVEDLEWWQNSLRKLFTNGNEGEWNPILKINHPVAELLESDPKEAVRLLLEETNKNPENLANELRLEEALLHIGLVDGAREIGERAILKAPESSVAHYYASLGYENGLLGARQTAEERRRQTELLKKAVELDPNNLFPALDLARMYQTDALSVLNSEDDLKSAARILAAHKDRLPDEFLRMLVVSHFYLGKYQEVIDQTSALPPDVVWLACRFAAQTELKGIDSAIAELKASFEEADQGKILLTAFDLLNGNRNYPAAEKVMQTVRSLQPYRNADLSQLIAVTKKLKRYDTVLRPETEVTGVVQRAWICGASERATFGDPVLLVDGSEEQRKPLLQSLEELTAGRREDARNMRTVERVADTISLLDIKVEGNEETACKVSVRFAGDITLFTARRDGRQKIVGAMHQLDFAGDSVISMAENQQLEPARQLLTWISDSLVGQLSFLDPSVGPVLPRLWRKSIAKEADADQIKLAALAIASRETLVAHMKFLEEQRDKAKKAEQFQIDRIMLFAAQISQDYELMLKVADRLCESRSGNAQFWPAKLSALRQLQRFDEADAFLETQIAGDPNSQTAREQQGYNAAARGQLGIAADYFRKNAESREALPADFNMSAWTILFVEPLEAYALEHATRAAQSESPSRSSYLHTLATVQAEQGRITESIATLRQSVSLRSNQLPDHDDYYVVGRVAEHLGLIELAKKSYQKVIDGESDTVNPLKTRRLAQARLDLINRQ